MIESLKKEVAELELKLEAKRSELLMAVKAELNIMREKFTLDSFIGKNYIFDKPFKWMKIPKKNYVFTEDDAKRYSYMWFNGVVSGKDINSLYSHNFRDSSFSVAKDEQMFAIFVIPDEEFEGIKNDIVPLKHVHELLIFKI